MGAPLAVLSLNRSGQESNILVDNQLLLAENSRTKVCSALTMLQT